MVETLVSRTTVELSSTLPWSLLSYPWLVLYPFDELDEPTEGEDDGD